MKRRSTKMGDSSIRYQKLHAEDEGFVDLQFQRPPPTIPYKAILLAVILCLLGTLLITISALLMTGHINAKYGDRMWPLLILGSILFIPGAYHVRIAVYAYKGYVGYSYDDIPEFD
ncbi:PREDICTED: transmembrane protein 230-like [Priapulus caudatus]|uniref:Transmembrane protein 230 n=1 Tax=Priapulus caudatus TaxID=37621 RepID=A0ABM1EPC5_PRICU|nr:PREDICTED: transmembrane protein 230-like [Priapulus caudatus]